MSNVRGALAAVAAVSGVLGVGYMAYEKMSPYVHDYEGGQIEVEPGTTAYDENDRACGKLATSVLVTPGEVTTEGRSGDPVEYGAIAVDSIVLVNPHSCEGFVTFMAEDIVGATGH